MEASRSVLIVLFALLAVVFATNVQAFDIYQVGDKIRGQEYNDSSKKWFNRSFGVWVGIDEDNTEFVLFKGDSSTSGVATVTVTNSDEVLGKLETAVSRAIEWAESARKNKVDGQKSLGCFGACWAYEENRMGLSFLAAGSGKQTDLIIKMVDVDNQSIKAHMYVGLPQMVKLLEAIKGIDEAMEKARVAASNQDLFK